MTKHSQQSLLQFGAKNGTTIDNDIEKLEGVSASNCHPMMSITMHCTADAERSISEA